MGLLQHKNLLGIVGLFGLVSAILGGLLVPYKSTIMRCSWDQGKTFSIIVRLDNFLISDPRFYNRQDGAWVSGNRKFDSGFEEGYYQTSTSKDAATQKQYVVMKAFGDTAEALRVEAGTEIFYVSDVTYDFVARTRDIKRSFLTTIDLKKRHEAENITRSQACRLD